MKKVTFHEGPAALAPSRTSRAGAPFPGLASPCCHRGCTMANSSTEIACDRERLLKKYSVIVLLTLVTNACTFVGDGAAWAELQGTVHGGIQLDADHVGASNHILTDLGYSVELRSMGLLIDAIDLIAPEEVPAAAADCHAGHCHSALLSLALADDADLHLAINRWLELVPDSHLALPQQHLGLAEFGSATMQIRALRASARVALDQALVNVQIAVDFDQVLQLSAHTAEGLPLATGPGLPSTYTARAEILENGHLFDGIDFAELYIVDGVMAIRTDVATASPAMQHLQTHVAELDWHLHVDSQSHE